MDQAGRGIRWERLAILRSPLMVLAGLACLCAAAFRWNVTAGLAAVGVSLIFLAYVTDASAPAGQSGGPYGR